MKRKNKINWTALGVVITGLALIVTIIVYWPQIKDTLFPDDFNQNKDLPFYVNISPQYFDEGHYEYRYDRIPFSIEVNKKTDRNITYLELSKTNFEVSRKDGGLNKPTSQVNWKDSRSDYILHFGEYSSYRYFPLSAEGEMVICQNCFIGKDFPYIFTFTIYYKEDNGDLKIETFNIETPIK